MGVDRDSFGEFGMSELEELRKLISNGGPMLLGLKEQVESLTKERDAALARVVKLTAALKYYASLRIEIIRDCGGHAEVPHRFALSGRAKEALKP